MAVSYKKLWKLLIDREMNKTELRTATGITTTALAKLGRNENVNTEVLCIPNDALHDDMVIRVEG